MYIPTIMDLVVAIVVGFIVAITIFIGKQCLKLAGKVAKAIIKVMRPPRKSD